MQMARYVLGSFVMVAGASTFALLDPEVPRVVSLAAFMPFLLVGGLLLGLDRPPRRHRRRAAR